MAKTKISEWSTTPASNTDIDGINIAEGCAPSGINDAIRDLMAQVRSWQSGASGDPFNGPMNGTIGATTAYSGAFTTLSASGTTTLSGLTASTALALDASKNVVSVANTGSGSNVLATSPTLVTPALGTPSSATLTNATGLPISTGVSGLGTGVATALAVNVGSAGAPVVNGGALGTPSSGTVTNLTGTASININGTVGATTPTTGAFTTTTVSTSETLSYGTANGVTYLNGSKVLTSGSALTFDGSVFTAGSLGDLVVDSTNKVVYVGRLSGTSSDNSNLVVRNRVGTAMTFTGTNAATGDGLFIPAAGSLGFSLTSAEQMRLTSTGLGIGTSSPTRKLDVRGTQGAIHLESTTATNAAFLEITNTGGTYYFGVENSAGTSFGCAPYAQIDWVASGRSRQVYMEGKGVVQTLDSTGNLGLGVTPSAWYTGGKALQIFNGSGGSLNAYSGEFFINQNAYLNSDASNWIRNDAGYASQYHQVNGKHIWKNAASSTAGSAISFTQAMTLDASGNLLVGTTSASAGNTFGTGILARSTSKPLAAVCDASSGSASVGIGRTNSTGNYVEFYYGTALTSSTGTISTNGTTTAYNITSDQRLKENIADADSASSLIDSLQVRKFDWKADGSHQRYGFVAQELVTVAPEAVHQPTDTEQMMAVDYSKLVPMLVKEIQSLRQRVAQLETN